MERRLQGDLVPRVRREGLVATGRVPRVGIIAESPVLLPTGDLMEPPPARGVAANGMGLLLAVLLFGGGAT